MNLDDILKQVASGALAPAEAAASIAGSAEASLGFARIDLDRHRRCGVPEVIFCPGKSVEQIIAILRRMTDAGHNVLASRISPEQARTVREALPAAVHHEAARCLTLDVAPLPEPKGLVAVVTAGTSDIPVAEEAALTASRMGARVERIFDVGVAGLHRLMKHLDVLRTSRAIVVVAGMEGALPSVVGGLVDRPLIAVPTSVGYGVNLGGLTTLMAMLNSCVPGISVVNIDNGFGAGVAAAMINRAGDKP
ncbi:MAG: nickel pincer cofactor biosynthesis protein LarB [Lentisphaerae bacterium]|nr:nickel pincer cofactor biosynthesis protein LarB [Lentisphaerota bacterium]